MDMEKRPSLPNAMTMVAEALESWGSVLGVVTKDNNKKTWGEILEEVTQGLEPVVPRLDEARPCWGVSEESVDLTLGMGRGGGSLWKHMMRESQIYIGDCEIYGSPPTQGLITFTCM